MLLNEISKNFKTKLEYHKTLNPKLWDIETMELLPDVEEALQNITNAFLEYLKVEASKVIDVIFTGSNANYNWSKLSDIDLHIILDYTAICKNCDDNSSGFDLNDCFMAKKSLWNDEHDITIKKQNVEVFVAPKDSPITGNAGVYSLAKQEWIQIPTKEDDLIYDTEQIKRKAKELMSEVDMLDKNSSEETIQRLKDKIAKMRKASIVRGGEFSMENLVFKTLRNNGYLQKLSDLKKNAIDNDLSLK